MLPLPLAGSGVPGDQVPGTRVRIAVNHSFYPKGLKNMPFVSGISTGNSYWEGEIVFPFKHKGRRRKAKAFARRAGKGVIRRVLSRA